MRWQHGAVAAVVVAVLFMACSGGAEPSDDDGSDFNGPGGGALPDVTALCEDQCVPLHATGEADYRAVRACILCDACYNVCLGEGIDLSACAAPPAVDGCSAQAATCADCVNGTCALLQDPATTAHSGLCAAQGDTCIANIECVGLTNCVSSCVTNSPQ